MKKFYISILFVFLFTLLSLSARAQNPCSGPPGSNTITPLNYTICQGSAPILGLANSYSTTGITYQWHSSPISIVGPWTTVPGATLHAFTGNTLTTNMYYMVMITCPNSSMSISVSALVTVISCTTPCTGLPASTVSPLSQTVCSGNTATLSLPATTVTGLTYQWGNSPLPGGPFTPIPGSTLASITTSILSSSMYYNVVITCSNSGLWFSSTGSISVVTCTNCSGIPASNTVLPMSQTVCAGSVASMSLANIYSTPGITYQWRSSTISAVGPFQNISGASSPIYTSPTLSTTTYYSVLITCTNSGQSITVPHVVTVVSCNVPCSGVPGPYSIVPVSATLCAGDVASMSLTPTYSVNGLSYQWASSPTSTTSFAPITGATLSTYMSPSLSANMYYAVIITCTNSGMSYTAVSTIAVQSCTYCSGIPGSNTILPVTHTICAGDPAIMSLANSYTASGITYQWQSSSTSPAGPYSIISGATSNNYTSPPLGSTTYFSVIITCTNSGQSILVPHTVAVVSCTTPCNGIPSSNTVLPISQTICIGNSAAMSLANPYLLTGMRYQWGTSTVQGGPYTAIPGATLNSYSSPTLFSSTYYNVVITCTNSSFSYTATHVVSVVPCVACSGTPAANSIVPPTYTVCSGKTATMNLANTYTVSGISYQWQSSPNVGGPFTPIAGAIFTVYSSPTLTASTHYNVLIICANNGTNTTQALSVQVLNCNGTGIPDLLMASDLKIIPNPNSGEFRIISSNSDFGELTLMDALGRKVLNLKFISGETTINISELPEGVYYAQVKNSTHVRVVKIVKE